MLKNKILFVLLAAIFYLNTAAQEEKKLQTPLLCGNGKIDEAEMSRVRSNLARKNIAGTVIPSTNFIIRVYFHVCRYNDGSNAAATASQIQTEFSTLNTDYAAGNICFINEGLEYIDNTALDTVNWDNTGGVGFLPYLLPDCINVFYTQKIGGTNLACGGGCGYGGITYSIPGIFSVVANGNIRQGHTISHEVGHCLGLLHPFETHGTTTKYLEDIDGSNGYTSADYVADTKADPYAFKQLGSACFATSANGCTYTGTCSDPNGKTNYSPPYTNVMGYWWAGSCYNNSIITTGQYNRLDTFLRVTAGLINTRFYTSTDLSISGAPTNNDLGPNLSITSDTNQYLATNQIYISGTNNVISGTAYTTMIAGSNVLLEPGLDVLPSGGGVTLFAATATCTSAAPLKNVYTEAANNNSISVFPNPASALVNISLDLKKDESHAVIELYDFNSKKIKQVDLGNLSAGKHTDQINVGNYPAGIYVIVVQLTSGLMRTKLVIAK